MTTNLDDILAKAVAGQRITKEEGLTLLSSHQLAKIGRAANEVSGRLHPESYRTYNIDRNINYTNICSAVCDFCAFYRTPKVPKAMCWTERRSIAKSKRQSSWAVTKF